METFDFVQQSLVVSEVAVDEGQVLAAVAVASLVGLAMLKLVHSHSTLVDLAEGSVEVPVMLLPQVKTLMQVVSAADSRVGLVMLLLVHRALTQEALEVVSLVVPVTLLHPAKTLMLLDNLNDGCK